MNWVSVIWTLIMSAGLVVCVRGLIDVKDDRRAMSTGNGITALLLLTRQRRLWVALVGVFSHWIIGVVSLLPIDFTGEGALVLIGLFLGGIAFVVFVFLEQLDRATIRRMFP